MKESKADIKVGEAWEETEYGDYSEIIKFEVVISIIKGLLGVYSTTKSRSSVCPPCRDACPVSKLKCLDCVVLLERVNKELIRLPAACPPQGWRTEDAAASHSSNLAEAGLQSNTGTERETERERTCKLNKGKPSLTIWYQNHRVLAIRQELQPFLLLYVYFIDLGVCVCVVTWRISRAWLKYSSGTRSNPGAKCAVKPENNWKTFAFKWLYNLLSCHEQQFKSHLKPSPPPPYCPPCGCETLGVSTDRLQFPAEPYPHWDACVTY